MTELAMRSTSGTDLVEVDPGCRIGAVRADGGAAEIVGRDASGGGAERRWRVEPTDRDLGWVTPPDGVAWTGFRATAPGATCYVELVPLEDGAP